MTGERTQTDGALRQRARMQRVLHLASTLLAIGCLLCAVLLVVRLGTASGLCTGGDEAAGYPYAGEPRFNLMPLGYRCVFTREDGAAQVDDPGFLDTALLVVLAGAGAGWLVLRRRLGQRPAPPRPD